MKQLSLILAAGLLIVNLSPNSSLAAVRVLHLSPDAPIVDVLVGTAEDNKMAVLTDVPYQAVSPYLPLPTGSYFIDVVPSLGGKPVIDVNAIAIDGGTDYSIAAVNVEANIEPLVLVDDNTIDPANARLRVVHASPDAGSVDVSVDGVGTVLSGVHFKDFSPYLSLPSGQYTVRILEAGTSNEVFVVPDLALNSGTVYSAFAAGLVNGQGLQAFTVLPTVDAVPEPASALIVWGLGAILFGRRHFVRR